VVPGNVAEEDHDMKRYVYEAVVKTPSEKLWQTIVDIRRWPEWHDDLEETEVNGAVVAGSRFTLKPQGGPVVAMSVERMEPRRSFVDVAHLPLAKMRTSHEFRDEPGGTRVRLTIEVWGPLGFVWDRLVARKEAKGAGAQTEALVRFAERAS
jgi:ligand-binding SRPBCC domain-containing protein